MTARGVIVQALFTIPESKVWGLLADGGATHALIGVPWVAVEPTPGGYTWGPYGDAIAAARCAGLGVIVRVLWPVPRWVPAAWASVNAAGTSSFDESVFLRVGLCPSVWCDDAWEPVYQLQDALYLAFNDRWSPIEFSPPGAGGGEWSYPTSHYHSGMEARVRQLWCFDDHAQASWAIHFRAGQVDTLDIPRTPQELRTNSGAMAWYCGGLRERMRRSVVRSPGKSWLAVIPTSRAEEFDDCVSSGQVGLDDYLAMIDCHVMVHCLFPKGSPVDAHDYCFEMMPRWNGRRAVGIEGIEGMTTNVPKLYPTPCTDLLIGVEGLLQNMDMFRYWCQQWRAGTGL